MSRIQTYLKKYSTKLKQKHIAIVGVGALGCFHALLLSRLGVKLTLIDRDVVEADNLSTQVLFKKEYIGKPKVDICKQELPKETKINTFLTI